MVPKSKRPSSALSLHQKGDPYSVLLGRGLLKGTGSRIKRLWRTSKVVVITHKKLERLFGEEIRRSFADVGLKPRFSVFPQGETTKNLDTVRRLYDRLIRDRQGREDGVVALGGGVVGDTAGFVAATYLRGVDYVQIPTTLLAQIDSSIGAKVGVNHPQGKNLIGAIYRPAAVWIDPDLLASLPAREFRSGLFEMLKYGFIGSPKLFRQMEKGGFLPAESALDHAIALSVRAKLAVVREDERESGRRRILNFGHTIGHGLEAAGDYRRLTHGEAVGWGMIAASRLAHRLAFIDLALMKRMEAAVKRLAPLPSLQGLRGNRIMQAVDRDKKIGPRGYRFVVPKAIGRVEVLEAVPRKDIQWAVQTLL